MTAETAAAGHTQHQQPDQPEAEKQQPLELEEIFVKGTLIGNRYQVMKKLGDGGTADVFMCNDLFTNDKVWCQSSGSRTQWHQLWLMQMATWRVSCLLTHHGRHVGQLLPNIEAPSSKGWYVWCQHDKLEWCCCRWLSRWCG